MTYPYPKGEHMGAVGAQICELLKLGQNLKT
jgi:hypothetical protein